MARPVKLMEAKPDQSEILFYHLEQRPLEEVLPVLLQKSLERGWNAIVQVGKLEAEANDEALKTLDKALWTFSDTSFLPHCIYEQTGETAQKDDEENDREYFDFAAQPVLLCAGDENPNKAQIRFYVMGAEPLAQNSNEASHYDRLVFMFDGHDPDAVIGARKVWKSFSKTHDATYWQQNAGGAWVKKG